jgi:Xaa-Pro aminopeptidase
MDLADRMHAVRKQMAAHGIDLLIASSSGFHSLDKPDAVTHLCGYRSLGESFLLIHCGGSVTLYVSPASDAERVAIRYSMSEWSAIDDLGGMLESHLSRPRLKTGRVATVGLGSLPYKLSERVLAAARGNSVAFDSIFYAATAQKTETEIQRVSHATAIAEKGFDRLIGLARPGMTEASIAVKLNCFTKSLGADDNFLMLSASPHNSAVMPSSSRRLVPGDILLAEFSPNFEGQFSQICRTVSCGPPRPELQKKYDLVMRAMWAGIKTIRPGIAVSEVSNAVDRVLEAAGYEKYCRPPYMRRRGHGLGCGSVAPGDIARDNHTILEADMVFVVHPNQYIPEVGYLLCGEPVRVTARGYEVLSQQTARLGTLHLEQAGSVQCE